MKVKVKGEGWGESESLSVLKQAKSTRRVEIDKQLLQGVI